MIKKISIFTLGFLLIAIPYMPLHAAITANCGQIVNGTMPTPCDFGQLMTLINNVINFLLFTIATPLVAIILCYVGFLFLTSGGSSEKMTKAKHILLNVIFGYIIGLAAWLIIKTILTIVGFDPHAAYLQY